MSGAAVGLVRLKYILHVGEFKQKAAKMSQFVVKVIIVGCCLFIWLSLSLIMSNIQEMKRDMAADQAQHIGPLRQHGRYWVWHDFMTRSDFMAGNRSLTLTTHATYMDLGLLPLLLYRWQAPISLAIHASGSDYVKAMQALQYIRECRRLKELMWRYVSVHLVFHEEHIPEKLNAWVSVPSSAPCRAGPPYGPDSDEHSYAHQHKLIYPVNLLRNVARYNAQTHYILALDIELIPTPRFARKFLDACSNKFGCDDLSAETVFCLAAFPYMSHVPFPESKPRLRQMLRGFKFSNASSEQAQLHHEWLDNRSPKDEISIFSISKQMQMCVGYVSINGLQPLYDERNPMESIYDEAAGLKAKVLKGLNYTFVTLDGAFLIHRARDRSSRTGLGAISEKQQMRFWLAWRDLYKHFIGPNGFRLYTSQGSRDSYYGNGIMDFPNSNRIELN